MSVENRTFPREHLLTVVVVVADDQLFDFAVLA